MHWSQIKKKTRLQGAFLDLFEEEAPGIPYHPELARDRVYRGKIAKIRWQEDGPILDLVELTEYNPEMSTWHPRKSLETTTIDLQSPGAMEPHVMKKGAIEVNTLNGFSVVIYPPSHHLPAAPKQTTVTVKDLLRATGLL